MDVVRSARALRAALEDAHLSAVRIGFVPTMGALHDGHLSLVRAARARSRVVVMSIFVNPLQFGPREDLASYPRSESRDLELATRAGVDLVFIPSVEEMYPAGAATTISAGPLGEVLEGADRPGHFDGVATVVAKLFNLVEPDFTFFGQKDAQQVAVVRQLVRDLSYDVELVVCPTVREPDGLALSSRNAYLSPEDRERATALHRALELGLSVRADEGDEAAEKRMWDLLVAEGVQPSYARVVDPDTFGPARPGRSALVVVAAHLGATRLIDNLLADPEG
jgi:pantoate--beta-alanine ligase